MFRSCSGGVYMDTMLEGAMQLELVAKAPEVATFPQIAAEEKHLYSKI